MYYALLTECAAVRDCKAWMEMGLNRSGIYPIKPDFGPVFQVRLSIIS